MDIKKERGGQKILSSAAVTLLALACAVAICFLLQRIGSPDSGAALVFMCVVLVVARYTEGYVWGIASALISVFLMNFVFVYPYCELNFREPGYPITTLTILAASIVASTLTTKLKAAEKARREIERERLRSDLLRAVSHDLRTPLTSIVGNISALREDGGRFTTAERDRLLCDALDDAQWLIRLVENLLSVTRVGGPADLRTQPEAVEEVLPDAVHKLRRYYQNIPVEIHIPEEPLFVPMDAMLIEQVLINLIENAVIHGAQATHIILTASEDRQEGRAVFTVEDNGRGIPRAILPLLFTGELSLRADNGTPSRRGMGIGLSVCSAIVQAHGGSITGANRAGGGAIFTFTLPLEGGENTGGPYGGKKQNTDRRRRSKNNKHADGGALIQ